MGLWRHRRLLMALLALLAPVLLTMAGHAADHNGNADYPTSVIDQQNQSGQFRLPALPGSKMNSDMGQFRLPGLPMLSSLPLHNLIIASTAPSPASEVFVAKNVGGSVFGEGGASSDVTISHFSTERDDTALGVHSSSSSSTAMLLSFSPIAEPTGTSGWVDAGSLLVVHDSSRLMGFTAIAAMEQHTQQPIVANHGHETPQPVNNQSDDEPISNPPQWIVQDAANLGTLANGNISDDEPLLPVFKSHGQSDNSGSTIPMIIIKLAPHAFDGSSQIQDLAQPALQSLGETPLSTELVNYLQHFIFARTTGTTYGAAPPLVGAPLSATYGALAQASAPSIATNVAPLQAGEVNSYNVVAAHSYGFGKPSSEVMDKIRVAAAGYASDLWNKFTKGVGTKAAKKFKFILSKDAPYVKKVGDTTEVESFFKGDSADTPIIDGLNAQVATLDSESQIPSATSRPSNTVIKMFATEDPLPSHNALPQNPKISSGAPPVLPATHYGASSALSWPMIATINKTNEDVRSRQVFIPEIQPPASGPPTKYNLEETDRYVVTTALATYGLTEPVASNFQASERHDVVHQGPTTFVGEIRPADPSHQRPDPAASRPEYNPFVQGGPPPVQPQAASTSGLHLQAPQARQVQYYSYLPPQASHLIRGHDEKRQAKESITTKLRNEISAGLDLAYNTYEYVKDFTYKASRILGAFWPGNWFQPAIKISQPVVIQSAPVAALVYR